MLLKELSARYGDTIPTLARYCKNGQLPAQKIKNRWHVKVSDYEEWKANRTAVPPDKINTKQCRRCRYGMQLASAVFCCNYLEETGQMRNCPTYPKCEKFEPKKKGQIRRKKPLQL